MMAIQQSTIDDRRNAIVQGHVLDVLRTFPDGSVHEIVTSPPYYMLRQYGTEPQVWGGVSTCRHQWTSEQWYRTGGNSGASALAFSKAGTANAQRIKEARWHDETVCSLCGAWRGELGQERTPDAYIDHLVSIFMEAARVLRSDGSLFVNIGDSYSNDTKWGGGSAPVKNMTSHAGGYQGQRVRRSSGLPPKSLMMIPARFAIAMQDAGWILRNDIIWEKPNGLVESVVDRCTQNHEHIFWFTKRPHYFTDMDAIAEPAKAGAKGSKFTTGKTGHHENQGNSEYTWKPTRNARAIWSIPVGSFAGGHFAVMPDELARRCIAVATSPYACEYCGAPWRRETETQPIQVRHGAKSGTYGSRTTDGLSGTMTAPAQRRTLSWGSTCKHPNQGSGRCIVLDPFAGVCTVPMVTRRLGRDYLGIELNPEYIRLGEERIMRDALPKAMKHVDLKLVPPSLWEREEE